jgi:hypothetical protein
MKQSYLSILICVTLFSCVTFKEYDDRAKDARETNYASFVQTEDGKIISGKTLKHKNYDPYDHNLVRVTGSSKAFSIDGIKHSDADVVAFQDSKAYHKRFHDLYLIRLVKGKINLYYFDVTGFDKNYTYSNGPTTVQKTNNRRTTFFFEKGDSGITKIGLKELREAVKDNRAALAKLNNAYSKDDYARELNIEKLVAVVQAYNK